MSNYVVPKHKSVEKVASHGRAIQAQWAQDGGGGGIRIFFSAEANSLATPALNGLGAVYSNDGHLLAAAGNFGVKGLNVIPPR